MVDTKITTGRNVIDFSRYQQARHATAERMSARLCRHCGAALGEGDSDDDCSSAGLNAAMPAPPRPLRKFRAE